MPVVALTSEAVDGEDRRGLPRRADRELQEGRNGFDDALTLLRLVALPTPV